MFNKTELTNGSGDLGLEVQDNLQTYVYLYGVVFASLLAIVTNTMLILTIYTVKNIRRATSSIFFVNLCVVEILASLSVSVACLAVLSGLQLQLVYNWQALLGGIQEFSKTVCILTIVQISFEKYMYIVHPMRHEACMTFVRCLAVLCVTWVLGLLVCSLPELCGGVYVTPVSVFPIRLVWNTATVEKLICVIYFVFMIVLPAVVITAISLRLYRVARRAMVAVEPAPNPLLPSCPSARSSRKYSTVFVVEVSDTQDKLRLSDSQCIRPSSGKSIRNGNGLCNHNLNRNNLHSGSEKQFQNSSISFNNMAFQRVDSTGQNKISRRALLFLTLPVCYFIVVWLPISIQQTLTSRDQEKDEEVIVSEIVSFIILQVSYAINPIFYSFMSKSFRQEALYAIKACCIREDDLVRPFSVEGSNEDFLQFLHRTSDSAQGEKDKDNKVSCNDCEEIVVLNSFPEPSTKKEFTF